MSQLNLTRVSVLYVNQSAQITIYSGFLTDTQIQVAIKEQLHDSIQSANSALNEAFAQRCLDHPHICKVFGFFLEETETTQIKSVIAIELMANDLMTEIEDRQKRGEKWREYDLISYLKDMSSTLEYAQSKSVSHRDIKPQNIFLTPYKEMKLGDFGSSIKNVNPLQETTTLNGSPFFLSPELKVIFGKQMMSGEESKTAYNPYRSDVYSLGLTFLYMARLAPPVELMSVANLQNTTILALSQLDDYPTLQLVLGKMLEVLPENRWDFSQIATYCQSYLGPQQSRENGVTLDPKYDAGNIDRPNVFQEQVKTQSIYDSEYLAKVPKTCFICQHEIKSSTWTTNVPTDLEQFTHLFPDLCSVKCARVIEMMGTYGDNGTLPCAGCRVSVKKQAVLDNRMVVLSCGHFLHDPGCLAKWLEQRGIDFLCPNCKTPIKKELIEGVLGTERCASIEKYVKSRLCDCCLLNAPVRSFGICEHRICEECGKIPQHSIVLSFFKGSNCPICNSTSKSASKTS